MAKGGSTQTTTQTNSPYKAAQPLLDAGMAGAMGAYGAGQLDGGAEINTAVPMSVNTQSGLIHMQNNANRAQMATDRSMPGLYDSFANSYANGGYNGEQRSAISALMPIARGDFVGGTDPNFEKVLERSNETAATGVNQAMAGLGRFGGGSHQGILADRLSMNDATMRMNELNNQRDRQMGAINSLSSVGQMGMTNLANAGDVFSSYANAENAAPNSELNVGSVMDDQSRQQINDQLRRSNANMTSLQSLMALAQGAGQFGTSTAQTPQRSNTLSNMLGAGLGGLSIWNQL